MSKQILLCADDYAQNQAISDGILSLSHQDRINAISCMVNAPFWPTSAIGLLALQATHYLGVHLNLTWGRAQSAAWQAQYGETFAGLPWLLQQCYLAKLNKRALAAEIQAQIQAFTQAIGTAPDFVDGHQHIQQLPIIRDILCKLYIKAPFAGFVRNTNNRFGDLLSITGFPKKQVIALLGGFAFRKQLERLHIPTNASFAGVYRFAKAKHYRHYFRYFLAESQQSGLIMCHPGLPVVEESDPLMHTRHAEMGYLMSDIFWQDLAEYDCELVFKRKNNV